MKIRFQFHLFIYLFLCSFFLLYIFCRIEMTNSIDENQIKIAYIRILFHLNRNQCLIKFCTFLSLVI